MISEDGKYLTFQFHPEYTCDYIKDYEFRTQQYNVDVMESTFSQEVKGS